jgi:hypothetical protein
MDTLIGLGMDANAKVPAWVLNKAQPNRSKAWGKVEV